MVTMLGDLLERETKFHVKPLPHARIPIVKLSLDPSPGLPHGITCDIGFENRLALENTRLLMCYTMIDPTRVRTLVLFREFNCGLSTFFDDSMALTIVTFPVPTTGTQGVSEPHMAYQYGEDGDTIAIFKKIRGMMHGQQAGEGGDALSPMTLRTISSFHIGVPRKLTRHGPKATRERGLHCTVQDDMTRLSNVFNRFYSCLPNILNNQYRHLDLRGIRPPPSSPLSLALSPLSPPLSLTLSLDLSPLLSSPLSPPSLCPAACLSSLCCRSIIRCSHFDQTFIGPHARHVPRSLHPPTTPSLRLWTLPITSYRRSPSRSPMGPLAHMKQASGANTPSSGNTPSPSHGILIGTLPPITAHLETFQDQTHALGQKACGLQIECKMRQYLEWELNVDPVMLREFEDMVKKDFVDNPSSYHRSLPASSNHLAPTPTYGHCYPSLPKPDFPPPNSSYITPPTSPDTLSPSYLTSTSPASTASPPTPQGMEDCTTCIVSASSSPGIPKFHPPNSSYITPPTSPDISSNTPWRTVRLASFQLRLHQVSQNSLRPTLPTSHHPHHQISPPTPRGMEDCTTCIVSASSSPGIPKFPPPNSSYITPPTSPDISSNTPRYGGLYDSHRFSFVFTRYPKISSAQLFLHHTTHITGHTITKLFNINVSSINGISSNTPRYGTRIISASSSPGIPKFPPPNSSYITPPTSSDTPLSSYSDCLDIVYII
ncbi:hypothetical protein BD769DRAFT_1679148 [Suillus cothurnatus]|nr:hypothetical protein BD769DRAFT_1679148 [Suillus cothurnatus]